MGGSPDSASLARTRGNPWESLQVKKAVPPETYVQCAEARVIGSLEVAWSSVSWGQAGLLPVVVGARSGAFDLVPKDAPQDDSDETSETNETTNEPRTWTTSTSSFLWMSLPGHERRRERERGNKKRSTRRALGEHTAESTSQRDRCGSGGVLWGLIEASNL